MKILGKEITGTQTSFATNFGGKLSLILCFLFLELLHCCYIYFHCSYLYNYYNYSRTLCYIKLYKSSLKCEGKEYWKNNKSRNKLFQFTKHFFLLLLLFWTLLTFKPRKFFYILFILNNLKCYRSITWNSTNHLSTLLAIEPHTRIFKCLGIGFCNIWWFVFLRFWPPLLWGAITFSILFRFLWVFVP
jgi:hypothetical protein